MKRRPSVVFSVQRKSGRRSVPNWITSSLCAQTNEVSSQPCHLVPRSRASVTPVADHRVAKQSRPARYSEIEYLRLNAHGAGPRIRAGTPAGG